MLDRYSSDSESSLWLIRRILSENFREYAPRYGIAFCFMALVAAMTSLSAWIMRDVVNEIFVDKDLARTWMISLVVLAIFTIKGIATYGQTVVLSRIGNSIVAKNQMRIYDRILKQDAFFFQTYVSSDLITRISHNAQAARDVLNMLVTSIGRDLLSLIGLITVMVIQDPFMSFFAFFIAPPAIWGVAKLVKRARKIAKAEYLSLAQIVMVMQETSLGHRIVNIFGMQDIMRARMADAVSGVEQRANKIALIGARTSPLMETLGGFAFAAVIFYSGWQTIEAGKSPGEFISFLTALLLAYEPAKRISRLQVQLEAGLVGVRLMFELLDHPIALFDKDNAKELVITKGDIQFKNVTFEYVKDAPVLKEISLNAQGGKITALVGPSGGGKSTLINMVQRGYDPEIGSIEIDGQDIRHITRASLNRNLALVTQDTILFTGTIRDNILHGRPEASEEDIIQAAKDAFAHDFIMQFPDGYNTAVGENGASLSGGQKQRIAIARAIIKNAPIILLDEATSALDSESEAKVQQAFARLMKDKTTLVIAHRLATIRHSDAIAVVKEGQLLELGQHDELLAEKGFYAHLVQLQFGEEQK
ncbi:MAG: ABC transporter ATP-binding protein/permease [Cohaesibacter sp.]|nr:ABC transporter ATP-binding protein/permease [Cohaesibacter sp.]